MEPNYVSLLLAQKSTAIGFIWNVLFFLSVSEKSIHNRIIKAKIFGLKINTPKNWIFFSFHFTFYVYTHFGESAALFFFFAGYWHTLHTGVCMSTLPMLIGIADSMTECSQSKSKKKNIEPSQPATNTVKKGKRKGKRKNAKQHNKNCQMKKRIKREKKRTPRTDRIFAENRHHKYIFVYVRMKRQQQMKEKSKSKWNKLPKMKTTRASKIYLYKTFSFLSLSLFFSSHFRCWKYI